MNPTSKSIPIATGGEPPFKRRAAVQLKGRQPDHAALLDARALIGPAPPDGHPRDLLIEYLHRLNDRYRGLFERHLVALASEMKLGLAEARRKYACQTETTNHFCTISSL